jgi:flavin reductase (DIM6/NTAB) family NADH-FMN oxidoreductase RutF
MTKVKFDPRIIAYPMPVCLVGANVKGKPNFMAVGWFSKVNNDPPMMMIALLKVQYTAEGIKENKVFSINFPGKKQVVETDFCGMVSGRNSDKSHVFKVQYGELKNAPMISECPMCFELKLRDAIELPDIYVFIGEVTAAYADEEYVKEGKFNIAGVEPFFLIESPMYQYMELGPKLAKAFSIGEKIKVSSS